MNADREDLEEFEDSREISIEFTLLSGETISVRDELDAEVTEDAVRTYAQQLVDAMGGDTIRTFTYWWEGEFYVDAVRMREVAALSVSTVTEDDDEDEDWDE
jgi:hypothetical protein